MMVPVTRTSPLTGKRHTMALDVTVSDYEAWIGGKLAQDAFPHLNAEEREFLKTGYTPEDWAVMFPGEEVEHLDILDDARGAATEHLDETRRVLGNLLLHRSGPIPICAPGGGPSPELDRLADDARMLSLLRVMTEEDKARSLRGMN